MRHITAARSLISLLLICLSVLVSAGASEGVGIGFGLSTGLSIPATARWSADLDRLHDTAGFHLSYYDSDPLSEYRESFLAEVMPSELSFHGKQAGLQFGGEVFLGGKRFSAGIAMGIFFKKRSTVSLLSSPVEIVNGGQVVRRLDRRLTSVLVFMRYIWLHEAVVSPYIGAGIGMYRIREHDPGSSYSVRRNGLGAQGVLGLEADLRDSRTRLFAEIGLNLSGLWEDWEIKRMDLATVTIAVGIRFRT